MILMLANHIGEQKVLD
ncbi:MAG: DUF2783 domain-containing protein [Gammaproteobacteria bacterium]|nr:DUF2783 domain-containing protein [Gammaproteobacteria bacterium]